MKKEIKDYLFLYLGCDVQVKRKNDKQYHIGRMCEVTLKSNHGDWIKVWFDDVITVTGSTWEQSSANQHWFFFGEDHIKPIVRKLSDMTEEEKLYALRLGNSYTDTWIGGANRTAHLLSKHFDLFGLIEAGLAIDKTKK